VGFVVDEAALRQDFSEYFSATDCFTFIFIIRGWYNRPVVGLIVGSVPLYTLINNSANNNIESGMMESVEC
jgi:hypothetical protein